MNQLSIEHVKSIDRAITILKMHLDKQCVPKYRREFRNDIRNLEQVKVFVYGYVTSPAFDSLYDAVYELAVDQPDHDGI